MLKPKEITVTDGDGGSHNLIISKFPAVDGLEINVMYPTSLAVSAIPKLGDYRIPNELMLKIMKYVAVKIGDQVIPLETAALVNSHTGDWEGLVKTILAIMEYNNSFFRNGTASSFFAGVVQKYQAKIIEILTQSSAASSPPASPPSTNSAPSTP